MPTILLRPGDMIHLDGIEILAVPAYNESKKFHPLENEWLGYMFTVDGITYYHSGDTDFLEAMNQIRCDVAFESPRVHRRLFDLSVRGSTGAF